MERPTEINLPFAFSISFCLHFFVVWVAVMPMMQAMVFQDPFAKSAAHKGGMRDIIVNRNEDEAENLNDDTLLSEKSSRGSGYLTKKRGDTMINGSLDFTLPGNVSSNRGSARGASVSLPSFSAKRASSGTEDADAEEGITIVNLNPGVAGGGGTDSSWTKVPDKKGITMENAIFISNDGRFSYNTKKFTDFKYFRDMKTKIASNWYPPIAGNAYMMGEMNRYGSYTPGYTRYMTIPSQEVKLSFRMDRSGRVIDVIVHDSGGSQSLVDSCVLAITNSVSFGNVPEDVNGNPVVINFIFGYYVQY